MQVEILGPAGTLCWLQFLLCYAWLALYFAWMGGSSSLGVDPGYPTVCPDMPGTPRPSLSSQTRTARW